MTELTERQQWIKDFDLNFVTGHGDFTLHCYEAKNRHSKHYKTFQNLFDDFQIVVNILIMEDWKKEDKIELSRYTTVTYYYPNKNQQTSNHINCKQKTISFLKNKKLIINDIKEMLFSTKEEENFIENELESYKFLKKVRNESKEIAEILEVKTSKSRGLDCVDVNSKNFDSQIEIQPHLTDVEFNLRLKKSDAIKLAYFLKSLELDINEKYKL